MEDITSVGTRQLSSSQPLNKSTRDINSNCIRKFPKNCVRSIDFNPRKFSETCREVAPSSSLVRYCIQLSRYVIQLHFCVAVVSQVYFHCIHRQYKSKSETQPRKGLNWSSTGNNWQQRLTSKRRNYK